MTGPSPSALGLADSGPASGPPLVLLHTIGTDRTLWSAVLPYLSPGLRIIRLDLPGHGTSPTSPPPGRIGAMISAVEAALDTLGLQATALLGHGLGGLIAQGLAVKRLDLIRALILSGTATKIGTRAQWDALAEALAHQGHDAMINGPAQKWLAPRATFDAQAALADRIRRQPVLGLTQAAQAIAGTDFYTATASLRLPLLGLVGGHDGFAPPDLMRETVDLVPGSQMAVIARAGHLAMVDTPSVYGEKVSKFLNEVGHLSADG